MAELTRLLEDLSIISLLDDEPNDVGGLPAEELKAKFDEAANIIKNYINETLLPQLAGTDGAANVGIETIPGVTGATNVQAALAKLESQLIGMTQGAVADMSITNAKLAAAAVTASKIAALAVTTTALADGSVTTPKLAEAAVTLLNVAANAIGTEQLVDGAVTHAKIANNAIGTEQIDEVAVTQNKLASGAVTLEKLALNTMYSHVKVFAENGNITVEDCGKTCIASYSEDEGYTTMTISAEANSAMPVGYEVAICRIHENKQPVIVTTGIRIISPGTVYETDGSLKVTIPEWGEMIALKKIGVDETLGDYWLLTGNADVEVVES